MGVESGKVPTFSTVMDLRNSKKGIKTTMTIINGTNIKEWNKLSKLKIQRHKCLYEENNQSGVGPLGLVRSLDAKLQTSLRLNHFCTSHDSHHYLLSRGTQLINNLQEQNTATQKWPRRMAPGIMMKIKASPR